LVRKGGPNDVTEGERGKGGRNFIYFFEKKSLVHRGGKTDGRRLADERERIERLMGRQRALLVP